MSRLVKKPISVAKGVTVQENGGFLAFKGPKGEEKIKLPEGITVKMEGENLWIDSKTAEAGTTWAHARNAIQGVSEGFMKVLEIEGVGYRAMLEGKELVLYLGYANPVRVKVPTGIAIAVEKNLIKVSGINKEAVGQAAAEIRALKKPEPYKGKGIHYQGEFIRRKVGKKAGATGTAA